MQYVAMDMKDEGALWFSNLLLPDPLYILPVVLLTTNLTIAAVRIISLVLLCQESQLIFLSSV